VLPVALYTLVAYAARRLAAQVTVAALGRRLLPAAVTFAYHRRRLGQTAPRLG
jgi:hypothetical protein